MLVRELRLRMGNPLGKEQDQYTWRVLNVKATKVVFCSVTTADWELTIVTTLETYP